MVKIGIIYYSAYGYLKQLAMSIAEGVRQSGCEPVVLRCEETLSEEVVRKTGMMSNDETPIATPSKMREMDGFLFGFPTRFGMVPAQMKALFDSTGKEWKEGAFVGKPAGFFFCTATQGGGQETTALTSIPFLAHHGMVFVPLGYTTSLLLDMNEIHGGSPYGCGSLSGVDGKRGVSALEKSIAVHQGLHFGRYCIN